MTMSTTDVGAAKSSRKTIFGWMMFDWASQPFYTLCWTFIFGPYLVATLATSYMGTGLDEMAADAAAQEVWSWTHALIGISIAICAPFLGAIADRSGSRMSWITFFSAAYIIGSWGLWYAMPDASLTTIVLLSFAVAMIGAEFTTIFTNAMMPDICTREETGLVSGVGAAMGYAGGVTALIVMLLFFEDGAGTTLLGMDPLFGLDSSEREGTRAVGPLTALWYLVFMIPFFLFVRDKKREKQKITPMLAFTDVVNLLKTVPSRPSLGAWLVGSMLLRDGLNALYVFGGTYAALVLNWEIMQIGIFGIVGAITAAVACVVGGYLDRAIGPKPVIVMTGVVLIAVVFALCFISRDSFFGIPLEEGSTLPDISLYVIGCTIGGMGGILLAAGRTMMVLHADPDRATEAFGLYALSGKATAFLAPMLIAIATGLTGSAQLGVMPVAFILLAGLILMRWVQPRGDL